MLNGLIINIPKKKYNFIHDDTNLKNYLIDKHNNI